MCAKASYKHAERDVAVLTGIRVSAKTQERMVKRAEIAEPVSTEPVDELTLDGGMVRVRTPREVSQWRQYHALRLNGEGIGMGWFKAPADLLSWVATLPLASLVYVLGDGHCVIWKIFEQMRLPGPRACHQIGGNPIRSITPVN